jgi:hypothetical protein
MSLPSAGSPMSMSMINTELGDGTFDTIDLKAASTTLGEGDAPYGMDELAGLSGTTAPGFSAFAATAGDGEIVITWTITNSPDSISLKVSNASNMSSPSELSTVNDGTHTQGSLNPSTQKFYQLSATNDGGTTNSSIITATSNGTTWGTIADFDLHLSSGGSAQSEESGEKSLTLANFNGNTDVTVEQPSNSSPPHELLVKIGNASGTYNLVGTYTASPGTINPASTYFMRFKLLQVGSKTNTEEDCTVSFTNNSVARTFEINALITSGIGGRCIHELMLVDTPMGQKSIYDLNIGDLVNSYNYELDMMENVPIKEIIQPTHENLYKVNRLILTEDHPIFDENGKLLSLNPELSKERYGLKADKLEVGHKLKTLNNEELIVNQIRKYNGVHKTYTIITQNDNFYVDGILVHSET